MPPAGGAHAVQDEGKVVEVAAWQKWGGGGEKERKKKKQGVKKNSKKARWGELEARKEKERVRKEGGQEKEKAETGHQTAWDGAGGHLQRLSHSHQDLSHREGVVVSQDTYVGGIKIYRCPWMWILCSMHRTARTHTMYSQRCEILHPHMVCAN